MASPEDKFKDLFQPVPAKEVCPEPQVTAKVVPVVPLKDAPMPDTPQALPQAPKTAASPAPKFTPFRMFRCRNRRCMEGRDLFDFVVEKGQPIKCPKCGWDMNHPQLPLLELDIIHFDQPLDEVNMIGTGCRACDPSKILQANQGSETVIVAGHRGTGHPLAVNCPKCKETEAYKRATGEVS
jgi:hypothetical protein